MKPKIILIGQIWKSEANGWVYHRGGYLLPFVVELIRESSPRYLRYARSE